MNFLGRPYTGGSTQQPQMSLASLGQQTAQRPQQGAGNPWGGSMGGVMNPQGGYQWGGGQGMGGGIWGNRGAQGGGTQLPSFSAPQVAPMGQPASPAQAVQGGINFGNPGGVGSPTDAPLRAIDGVIAGNAPGMPSQNNSAAFMAGWQPPTLPPQAAPQAQAQAPNIWQQRDQQMQQAQQAAGVFPMQQAQPSAGIFPMQQGQSSLTPPSPPPGTGNWQPVGGVGNIWNR